MSILPDLSEKRRIVGQDEIPEQPPKNRQKLDLSLKTQEQQQQPSEVKVKSSEDTSEIIYGFCNICDARNVNHWYLDCPEKERGLGKYCSLCFGPCKENEEGEHKKHIFVTVKLCAICGVSGSHWADECIYRDTARKDLDGLDEDLDEEAKVQSSRAITEDIYGYCAICKAKDVNHWYLDCPEKERGLGKFCSLCTGPCKENEQGEHKDNIFVTIKGCTICGAVGTHWADECSFRNPAPQVWDGDEDEDPDAFFNLFRG